MRAVLGGGPNEINLPCKSVGKSGDRRGVVIVQRLYLLVHPQKRRKSGIRGIREGGQELDHSGNQAQRQLTIQLVSFARGSIVQLLGNRPNITSLTDHDLKMISDPPQCDIKKMPRMEDAR